MPERVLLALLIGVLAGAASRPSAQSMPPVVAGLAQPGLDARLRGLVLLGELGCVACHQEMPGRASVDGHRGPDLATVGGRVHADYLTRYLLDPHGVEPGTTMPDLLRDRGEAARGAAAAALAQYLRSFMPNPAAPEAPDPAAAARGEQLFHAVGCVACHAPRNAAGDEVPLPGSVPLGRLQDKYPMRGLRAFLLAPHEARPAARMPDLHLTPSEAHELSNYLLQGATVPAPAPALDAPQVATGRALFAERGCAQCHSLEDRNRAPGRRPTALPKLDAARGCLSGAVGGWPYYALSDEQRADITEALRSHDTPLTDAQRIVQRLAARNCLACHQRGEAGGVTADRNAFFKSSDDSLGSDGRLPPPLTGVGAKLQRDWLVDAIAHGQSVRPYLRTRMPGFGVAFATELADLLARSDQLPPLPLSALPEDDKQARAITDLGRELVGDKGMNCIACHTFAGERVGTMGAVDLVDSTAQRLRREWFAHFLRAPVQFRPGTLMPQFFAGGVSARPELGGGDPARQIDAIWHYLAEGRNVGKPAGMRPPPIELTVGTEAVILRRSVQNTGKRGISVGYPLGVNLTFDAESLGLNQIWWGRFVDAAGVWTGQGSGEARILGQERVTLPKGPAFVALPNRDARWPDASRRELGQRFLGYDLDAAQRPTFRYVCDEVSISDAPVDVAGADNGSELSAGKPRPVLRRTFTFRGGTDKTLHFRAACAARIDDYGGGVIQVGPSLRLRLGTAAFVIRPVGDQRELLVAVPLHDGKAELVIDYTWWRETR